MSMHPARRKAKGLSLVELMIAILIGTILLLGLVQIYAATRESYRLSEGMSRVQENGRFALDFLQRDIRLAGHFGCMNDQARIQMEATAGTGAGNVLSSHPTAALLNFRFSIQGFDGPPPFAATLNPAPLAASDSIILRFLTGEGVPVTGINAAAGTITVDNAKWDVLTFGGVATPELFGIADCTFADVFAAQLPVTGPTIVAPGVLLDQRYTADVGGGPASLYRAEALVYYIGNGAGGQPSLFRARLDRNGNPPPVSEELVEGIDNMQLRYGMAGTNANGEPNGNVQSQGTATEVTAAAAWPLVGQVQLALLASSPNVASAQQVDAAFAANRVPNLLGVAPVVPNDRRYRSVYQSTIALRNRLYGN